MIESIPGSTTSPTAADSAQQHNTQKTLRHTPFGDVMVDELETPDVFGMLAQNGTNLASPTSSAATATAPRAAAAAETGERTAQSLFGDRPWIESPSGNGPIGPWYYNPAYFATRQTAEIVAAMTGGEVVEQNALTPFGPLQQQVPNEMIELPNGRIVNAGIIANFFDHGFPQSFVDRLLQLEIQGP